MNIYDKSTILKKPSLIISPEHSSTSKYLNLESADLRKQTTSQNRMDMTYCLTSIAVYKKDF
jgi:hypothetical protein